MHTLCSHFSGDSPFVAHQRSIYFALLDFLHPIIEENGGLLFQCKLITMIDPALHPAEWSQVCSYQLLPCFAHENVSAITLGCMNSSHFYDEHAQIHTQP
jgi:hypothetical protein